MKKVILLLICAAMILTPFTLAAGESAYVFLDGEEVTLSVTAAYFDTDIGIIMAPLELYSNVLDCEVSYDIDTGDIIINRDDSTLNFTVGDTAARLNNRTVTLDTMPVIMDGEVYIPMRFSTENLGYELSWSSENKRVELKTIYEYELGISIAQMRDTYGAPAATRASEKGYTWQVYNEDLADYQLIGIDGERVVAYYVNSDTWKLPAGIAYGTRLSTCNTIMNGLGYQSIISTGYTTYTSSADTLTVYYDSDELIYAALLESADYAEAEAFTDAALTAMETTLGELCSIMRIRRGLEPLETDRTIAGIARAHAQDMAENDFFSHSGSSGLDKTGRMDAAGFKDYYISEAMAKAYPDAFRTFASLYTNISYRDILSANFESMGVGYAYGPESEGVIYCVELFYAERG